MGPPHPKFTPTLLGESIDPDLYKLPICVLGGCGVGAVTNPHWSSPPTLIFFDRRKWGGGLVGVPTSWRPFHAHTLGCGGGGQGVWH